MPSGGLSWLLSFIKLTGATCTRVLIKVKNLLLFLCNIFEHITMCSYTGKITTDKIIMNPMSHTLYKGFVHCIRMPLL